MKTTIIIEKETKLKDSLNKKINHDLQKTFDLMQPKEKQLYNTLSKLGF